MVEDDPTNRLLLRAVLSRASDPRIQAASVVETTTLQEARHALEASAPDLIFLDVRLPDGNGLDLAREISMAHPDGSRPRILVLSASVLQPERDAVTDAGCDAFLGKPYRPRDLLDAIDGLLNR